MIVSWNRGKGREVYRDVVKRGVKVHRSVRTRMLAQPMEGSDKYLPKVRFAIGGKLLRLGREKWLVDKPDYIEWVD